MEIDWNYYWTLTRTRVQPLISSVASNRQDETNEVIQHLSAMSATYVPNAI